MTKTRPFMDYEGYDGIRHSDCGGMLKEEPDYPKFSGPRNGKGRNFRVA